MAQLGNAECLPAGVAGVFLTDTRALAGQPYPWLIDGRPVRALAPHPQQPDLVYLTTEHPETLAFLPDEYTEIGT